MKKRIILFTLLLLSIISLTTACGSNNKNEVSEEIGTEGLKYYLQDDNTYAVCGGETKYLSDIVIPSTYNGKAVTKIESPFCDYESSLKSITIPNSITSIEDYAFSGCVNLTNVYYKGTIENWCNIMFGVESNPMIRANNFYILDNNGSIEYNGNKYSLVKEIDIPDTITVIIDYQFYGFKDVISVTIPNSVTSIGSCAFSGCSSLTSIIIPDSVTSIEYYAFSRCSSLTSIEIPNSVTSIGNNVFEECVNLKYNEYDNAYYLGNDENPYLVLVKAKSKDITSCKISNSTKIIYSDAFSGCSSLTSITIPNSVTSIGWSAFRECSGLTSVDISSSVTSIGYDAFYACYKLVEVYNLSSLNITKGSSDNGDVGRYAKVIHTSLEEESNLIKTNDGYLFIYDNTDYYLVGYEGTDTELTLPNNINGNSYKINDYAFRRCRSLTSIIIPEGVTNIGNGTFIECSSLKNIEILSSITSIGNFTFESCSSLENIEIPSSVTNIGTRAFEYCSSLISVIIPEGVISIGDGAFEGCVSLSTASIPSSLVSMGNYVFEGCDKLNCSMYDNAYYLGNEYNSYLVLIKAISTDITSCEIGRDTKFIYYDAFEGCSSLTSITIPSSVISIGSSAFKDCSGLTSITLPFIGGTINGTEDAYFGYIFGAYDYSSNYNFVPSTLENVIITGGTSIEYGAFAGCVSLKNITLPLSITSIGDRAFYYCSNLTKINIPSSVTSIGENVFDDCSNLKPNEDDTAYYLGNEENPYLVLMALKSTDVTSYEISSYTKLIYSNAFYYCESLTDIIIPNSVISIGNHIFERCHSLTNVYYYGTNEDWSNIMAESTNERLENATIYYYSETEPLDTTNKYWHYVDDIIVVW